MSQRYYDKTFKSKHIFNLSFSLYMEKYTMYSQKQHCCLFSQNLLQHQTPDMRSLSMDLPPIPKSDSAEAFLKDAPQENSELLYCQYLLGATEMKLILKGVL